MEHPLQEAYRGEKTLPLEKNQGGRIVRGDLSNQEMGQTIIGKAKTAAMVIESREEKGVVPIQSKEEKGVVPIQSKKGREVVARKEIEAPQDPAETLHHTTPIMKHQKGITGGVVGVEIAMGADLEAEGDHGPIVTAGTTKEVEEALEIGEEVEIEGQKIGQMLW